MTMDIETRTEPDVGALHVYGAPVSPWKRWAKWLAIALVVATAATRWRGDEETAADTVS